MCTHVCECGGAPARMSAQSAHMSAHKLRTCSRTIRAQPYAQVAEGHARGRARSVKRAQGIMAELSTSKALRKLPLRILGAVSHSLQTFQVQGLDLLILLRGRPCERGRLPTLAAGSPPLLGEAVSASLRLIPCIHELTPW